MMTLLKTLVNATLLIMELLITDFTYKCLYLKTLVNATLLIME